MRRAVLWLSALATAVTLLSALAVLVSWLVDPAYRLHYGDSLLFVLGYAALQVWILWSLVRDTPAVPWIAVAKALAGWVFIALFVSVGPLWMRVTPARYVYQLFDWGPEARVGLFALVFLGRGAFNTVSAIALTRHWWSPLRRRWPLLGRLASILPVAATVSFVWLFLEMVQMDAKTFSSEAYEVAGMVLDGIDCDSVRQHEGQTTTDLRQRGDRRYHVTISWHCADVLVQVRAEDGRLGVARGPRLECCPGQTRAPEPAPAPEPVRESGEGTGRGRLVVSRTGSAAGAAPAESNRRAASPSDCSGGRCWLHSHPHGNRSSRFPTQGTRVPGTVILRTRPGLARRLRGRENGRAQPIPDGWEPEFPGT